MTWRLETGQFKNQRFFSAFLIGRDPACAVHLDDSMVSRHHAEVFIEDSSWHIRDLNSTNGTFIGAKRISREKITQKSQIGLGRIEPTLCLEPEAEAPSRPPQPQASQVLAGSATQFVRHYFDKNSEARDTEQARVVREAFERISKKRTRKYKGILVVALILLMLAGGAGVYGYLKLQKLRSMAANIFYTMKTLEVQLARQELVSEQSGSIEDQAELDAKRAKMAALGREYDQYVEQTDLFGVALGDEDRLIYKVARLFGECELYMPPSFVREVKLYIKKWKTTPVLERAIARAEAHGFLPVIQRAMTKQDLPLQFFYLGLRESGFQVDAVGPETRYGIAKGPWQFIPETASRYGMNIGPLAGERQFDPGDERFDVFKSTHAAARYLKDIYATKAQASGLLVMASYNWGEQNINRLLDQMPENPRERNFWELINRFTIPDETYQYVLYIFSAAVIGENPGVFGFDFEDPLAGIKQPVNE
ncbi:MAG: FHA domain-containing protein [Methylococcaceae bacterium]|nr:FHA domain-containing protein [Methylococcaceae bacterium]